MLREAGYDEYRLQSQIYDNPGSLGLGDLEVLDKEVRQSPGGKLDLLLKDREGEGDAMYEVEVMLGATDGNHIVRTLEYYDTGVAARRPSTPPLSGPSCRTCQSQVFQRHSSTQ